MKQCKVIKSAESFQDKQGLTYFSGVSAESSGSDGICMHILVMPPGAKAKPHFHENMRPRFICCKAVRNFIMDRIWNSLRELTKAIMFTFLPVCRTNPIIQLTSQP